MTTNPVHESLRFRFNEQFSADQLPDELDGNEFVAKHENNSIVCPEGECTEKVNVADSDPPQFVCPKGHINPYDESKRFYFDIDTSRAIEELLSEVAIEGQAERDGGLAVVEDSETTFVVVPGDYRDTLLQNLGQYLSGHRNICIMTFTNDCRDGIKRFIDRFGGLSMVVQPPNVKRKVSKFTSLVDIRNSVEADYLPENEEVPEDLVQKIHDNPQFVVSELINYEKIEGSKAERERMEQLSTLAFSQLMNFPLNSLGMADRGNRIPDGFGFIFDRDGSNDPLLILDSKSVSSKTRAYPKITEADDAQYRKYLEIAEDISYQHGISQRAVVFISPEYSESKIHDFLDELGRSDLDEFRVLFMELEALAALLLLRSTHAIDRKIRLDKGRWEQLLYNLVVDPKFDREPEDYELERKNADVIDKQVVVEHISQSLDEQRSKEEIIKTIEEKFKEFDPHKI
ncbi:hypothetical protein [Haladaptatus salinisoli]|uniref:hypothetical protein n=1 Tax=Haladaptatus salinisoli TaxID=2884876 RepID=UPI001D0A9111|nr:hypothetical protein [Haladaptatus salinisoli]